MGSEPEEGVGQDGSNRPKSPIYRFLGSITNKFSTVGSYLGKAAKTVMSSLGLEHPSANLPSAHPHGDDMSTPPADFEADSIPPNQEDVGQPHRHAGPRGPRILPVSTTPVNPSRSYIRVRRIRIRVSPLDPTDSANTPVDYQEIDIDLESGLHTGNASSRAVPPLNLGKTFLGVTYQAMYSFFIFHYQAVGTTSSEDRAPKPSHLLLQIAEVNLVVGFAATLIGILLREPYQKMSAIMEIVGYVSAAFGFFVMVSMLLTDISEWIGWICAVGALLAFLIAFIKRKK